jgi:phage-related protein
VGLKAQDEVSGVVGRIQSAIGSVTGLMSQMGGVMGDVGNIIGSAFSGFATGGPAGAALGAGTAALSAVVTGIQSCVKEATASEAVWASLGAAVERSGRSWDTLKAGTESALLSMSRFTTYSDEQVAQTMERLMTYGLSYDQAMKALGPTLDFAAAKHMDLESAATLVGKAVDGNTAIMKRYGVDVEVAKDAADKMTPVLAALNDQFGGAAKAAAETYAGTQERLAHAQEEVGEKIGNIMLPALTSLTEAMIPVVDQFGKGVDAVSAWLTEVSKMPEVQGFMASVQDAFKGFWDYLQGLWSFIQEEFGPALEELWSAFKDLWDALSPIGHALKELLGVFGDTGNIDLLRSAIEFAVIQIRTVAFVIKEVSPYIKAFAQAFKEAADFITPILKQIVDAVKAFTDTLHMIFQDFYNWLIGRSLWIDLWNQIALVTNQMIAQLLSDLAGKLFKPMLNAWLGALGDIRDAIMGWGKDAVGLMTGIMGQLQGAVSAGVSGISGMWDGLVRAGQGAVRQVQDLFGQAQSIVTQIGQGIVQVTKPATDTFQNLFDQAAKGVISAGKELYDMLVGHSIWPEMFTTMEDITANSMSAIDATVSSGMASAVGTAKAGLSEIQSLVAEATAFLNQPHAAGTNLSEAFAATQKAAESAYRAPVLVGGAADIYARSLLTMGASQPGGLTSAQMEAYGQNLANLIFQEQFGRSPSKGPATAAEMRAAGFTIPVTVQIDGATVAKTVEQRMITQRQLSGG